MVKIMGMVEYHNLIATKSSKENDDYGASNCGSRF